MISTPPRIALIVPIEADLQRAPLSRRCRTCHTKRVLVSIRVSLPDHGVVGTSESRCLECWGVREIAAQR